MSFQRIGSTTEVHDRTCTYIYILLDIRDIIDWNKVSNCIILIPIKSQFKKNNTEMKIAN